MYVIYLCNKYVIFTIRAKISPAVSAWINFDVDRAFYITIAALIKSMHLHTMACFHYFRNEELAIAK